MTDLKNKIAFLEQEIIRLTEDRRFAMTTLEVATKLLTLETAPNEKMTQEQKLREYAGKILSLLDFKGVCFYLINEEDASFYPVLCEPADCQSQIEASVDQLIEDQTFAWALSRNKTVRAELENNPRPLVLHALSTATQTRGMFVGLPQEDNTEFESPLPLLTILLHSCANSLERLELFQRMSRINRNLEASVAELKERSATSSSIPKK